MTRLDWLGTATLALALTACSGGSETPTETVAEGTEAPAATPLPTEPTPTLLVAQAWFQNDASGRPQPQPAKLALFHQVGDEFVVEEILDPESNVFHKAIPWRDGILTIGAEGARLKHWTRGDDGWTATQLWEKSWGGQFDRLRDLELGDVDGDGQDELIIATHDQGVVAVGDESDGVWTFSEMDQTPDIFVHEVEAGDVDGDGKIEFYATPSARNRADLTSQPGKVVRYDYVDGSYVRSEVISWEESHAKEILVADLGQGPQLFAVREGHSVTRGGQPRLIDPVQIYRLDRAEDGTWSGTIVASVEDHQMRFLVPGDIDHDGTIELVGAGFKSGLWRLEPKEDGTFDVQLIDRGSSGFEHASHVADLDGDGKVELYVAADDQKSLRRYLWDGQSFQRSDIGTIGSDSERHLSWNIQDGTL